MLVGFSRRHTYKAQAAFPKKSTLHKQQNMNRWNENSYFLLSLPSYFLFIVSPVRFMYKREWYFLLSGGLSFFFSFYSYLYVLYSFCFFSGKSPLRNVQEILQNNIKYHYRNKKRKRLIFLFFALVLVPILIHF